MNAPGNSAFTRSVKGKVVIAFLAGCVALGLAWIVSRTAFREMLHTVKSLSEPNEKLRIVNNLFRDITQLDQLQKRQALLQANSYKTFLNESKALRLSLDSLRMLYADNPAQQHRLDSMKRLLLERDKLFLNYLKVRQGLVNNNDLTRQVQILSELILNYTPQIDSTVITTEKKVSTTFIYPSDSATIAEDEKEVAPPVKSSFFSRLFGKKKPEVQQPAAEQDSNQAKQLPAKMVKEEVNIKIDTLALAKQDSIMWEVEKAMQEYEKERRLQSSRFVNREIELANASSVLTSQMLSILQEVEREVVKQEEENNQLARNVVSTSVLRISIIMGVFLLLMAILVYLILTDIARSNAYRQALEVAKEEAEYHSMAKQRFLANMSHEIRTPLQSIIGYADLLRQQDKPSRKHLDAIYHSSEHLLHIVNEVLDYSRIISGKFTFAQLDFDLRQLLEEVMSVMRPQAEKKSLDLSLHDHIRDNAFLNGDPFRLKQLLYNLIGNAIKFTEQGGVSLTVEDAADAGAPMLTFTVSDTGKGIAPRDVRRIFNQFEQAGDTYHHNGTGLGLSIVKALTEAQNGSIEVTSEPGKGSSFAVQLPFAAARQIPAQPRPEAVRPAGSFSGKVWVVDDDPFILHLCASIFEKHGVDHTCFQLPEDLLRTPWDDAVTLILADMRMPGMNGAELCRQLRLRIPGSVKIFALTAQALPEEREAVLQEGFDGLVMKPFREPEILALLDENIAAAAQEAYGADTEHEDDEIDLSALEKLTFGDKAQLQKILERFVTDNQYDVDLLCSAAQGVDMEQMVLVLHRMAGRTAQIGAGELAARLRMLEIALQQHTVLPGEAIAAIDELAADVRALLQKVAALLTPAYPSI